MIRQPAVEQEHRLTVKTVDQVFVARAQEWLGCSLFEALPHREWIKQALVRAALDACAQEGVLTCAELSLLFHQSRGYVDDLLLRRRWRRFFAWMPVSGSETTSPC